MWWLGEGNFSFPLQTHHGENPKWNPDPTQTKKTSPDFSRAKVSEITISQADFALLFFSALINVFLKEEHSNEVTNHFVTLP